MKLTKNIIALQKRFVASPDNNETNFAAVATIQAHLMFFGYMFDSVAYKALSKANIEFLKEFNDDVVTYLREVTGGKKSYKSFYKNFPEEVMSLTESDMFYNMLHHYWSGGIWEPSTIEFQKPIAFENVQYKMITFCDEVRFNQIFTDLVSVNTSLTPNDLEVVKWFAENVERLIFPIVIPFKENLCTLAAMGVEGVPVKTVTDVLRIAVHLSGGDISLPKVPVSKIKLHRWDRSTISNPERERFKFKKFSRKTRKYLLGLLENTNCDVREMKLYEQRWIRLGEILHPGEYKNQFPKVGKMFKQIRNENVQSWYGQVEVALKSDLRTGLSVLSQRPGEFSRKLDMLVRKYPNDIALIMEFFTDAVKETSNKVLFEVYTHFEGRTVENKNRSIMVKGSRKRTQLPSLPALQPTQVSNIQNKIFDALKKKFSSLEPLGKCWIDEDLKKIPLPTNMRSLNFSTKPTVRGQRIPFGDPNIKVIRAYSHFTKNHTSITIDLAATLIGERVNSVVDWRRQILGEICMYSGDSFARTGDCAEYMDIDIQKAIDAGYQYVLIQLHNYTQSPLLYDNNYFGIMERNFPQSNKIWLPETLKNAHIINNLKNRNNCAILDLSKREYIIIDEDGDANGINVASIGDFKKIAEYIKPPKVSVYDLISMHVDSRGVMEDDRENADTLFTYSDFSESYEKIGQLMGV